MHSLICPFSSLALLLGILLPVAIPAETEVVKTGPFKDNLTLVAGFNHGIQNAAGGYHNPFERMPSRASTTMSKKVLRGDSGCSLRIDAHRESSGFCGTWIHLFDFRALDVRYFDMHNYEVLSFWLKGEKGGEMFSIKLADRSWIEKEDSAFIGTIEQFLPGGVTTTWQEVVIPLDEVAERLDLENMGGLTLEFETPGTYTIYIDDISVKTSRNIPTPLFGSSAVPPQSAAPLPLAMWVWKTPPLLLDATKRAEFFSFCAKEKVGTVWLQVVSHFEPGYNVYGPPAEGPPESFRAVLEHPVELRGFLKEAHAAGLEVHALDGYPEYAQQEYHFAPLAIADSVIAFNRNSAPDEGFDGIHFDNEPYLILGWKDADRREQILHDFLVLNDEIQRRVDQQPNLVFGIDIPFWFQDINRDTGQPLGWVTYKGVSKPASYHCIDLFDNIGIMNYRDAADGADGIIAHGKDLIEYGRKAGHAKIFMGVETFSYDLTDVWFAVGLPRERFKAVLPHSDISYLSRISGFPIKVLDDGENVHVGIELPAGGDGQSDEIRETLVKIAQHFSAASYPDMADQIGRIRSAAERSIAADPEWADAQTRNIAAAGGGEIPGFLAVSVMLGKTSFADESFTYLREQLDISENFFQSYDCFAGMAIHYYETFRQMAESRDDAESVTP